MQGELLSRNKKAREHRQKMKLGKLEKEILMCLGKRQKEKDREQNPFATDLAYDVLHRRLDIDDYEWDKKLHNDKKLWHHLEVLTVSVMRALISLEKKGLVVSGQRRVFAGGLKNLASHNNKTVRLASISDIPEILLCKHWIRRLYNKKSVNEGRERNC